MRSTPASHGRLQWRLPASRFRYTKGITLVEVMIAMMILAMVTLGTLGTLLTTRQMADFARKRMMVDAAVQGVLEQLKSRSSSELLPTSSITLRTPPQYLSMEAMKTYLGGTKSAPGITVNLDNDAENPLMNLILSPYSKFIDPRNIPAGAIPQSIDKYGYGDLDGDKNTDVGVNVLTLHLRPAGSSKKNSDDINIYIMVWVKDCSVTGTAAAATSQSIQINYTWIYKEGAITRKMVDSARAIRTNV